jgi:hypothetical protein
MLLFSSSDLAFFPRMLLELPQLVKRLTMGASRLTILGETASMDARDTHKLDMTVIWVCLKMGHTVIPQWQF